MFTVVMYGFGIDENVDTFEQALGIAMHANQRPHRNGGNVTRAEIFECEFDFVVGFNFPVENLI